MHISKNQIKFIRSLGMKKHRDESGVFVAEGHKCVGDLLQALRCQLLVVPAGEVLPADWNMQGITVVEATQQETEQASQLRSPQGIIGIFEQPETPLPTDSQELMLAIDGVQDPGNLGTIIRTADWFGIRHIICSQDTADVYNPKVVQATMGALARVAVHYTDLSAFLTSYRLPVYGTLLDGDNIYNTPLSQNGLVIMGNEGKGITEAVRRFITHPLLIPSYPAAATTSESLNVSIATGVVLAEFRRRK